VCRFGYDFDTLISCKDCDRFDDCRQEAMKFRKEHQIDLYKQSLS